MTRLAVILIGLLCSRMPAFSQGRGGIDWSTSGNDAQRSSWVRTDPKISPASLQKPGFQFLWKSALKGPLSAPVLMDRYIGHRGFRSYAFIGGSGDSVFVFDSDLSRIEWQKHFPLNARAGTAACPGGMTAGVARGVSSAFPGAPVGRGGGGGRGGPAKSGVGAAGEGAVTLSPAPAQPNFPPAGRGPAGPGRGRAPTYLNALSSDGAFHSMYVSNGDEPEPPVKFVPSNANVSGLIVVDEVAYAVTSGNCGETPDGLWALDIASKTVSSWKGSVVGSAGAAFGPEGTLYVATANGDLVALEPKTLTRKASYSAGQALASSPIVFDYKGKALVAAAAKDGSIHIIDAGSMTKLAVSAASGSASGLASWQDSGGTRWILGASGKGIAAWKLVDQAGVPALQTGWTSRDIASPTTPAVVNGFVFVAASGSASSHAVIYGLDASTGKELWSSGNTITSFIAPGGGLAAGGSSVYLGTHDGTFWAFGFPIEH